MLLKKVFHGIINGINYHIKYKLNYGMKPTYLIYQITQRCNGKCIMCNIWDKEFKKEVEINDISKAFSDRLFDNLKWIVLTGGEPFLRNDLVEIIKILNKLPHLKWITINTNGFLTKKIISNVKDILKILRADITLSLTVSVHGIGMIHNHITRTPLAYNKATNTLKALKKIKNKKFHLQILSVITKYNSEKLNIIDKEIKKLCMNVNFIYPTVSKHFENQKNEEIKFNEKEKISIINFLKSTKSNDLAYAFYLSEVAISLKKNKRDFICLGGYKTMFLNTNGDIFPCQPLAYDNSTFRFGNFLHNNLNEIWYYPRGNSIRKNLKKCNVCKSCVFSCDIINNIENQFFQFAFFLFCHPTLIKNLINKKYLKQCSY